MGRSQDQGLTVLEVIIAITIFMIGIAFILQSDAVSHKYLSKGQVRQQMLFYAAGLLEAHTEGVTPVVSEPPFSGFSVDITTTENARGNSHLQMIQVRVEDTHSDVEPVTLYTYRVKYDEEE